jgi:hypothetical protein
MLQHGVKALKHVGHIRFTGTAGYEPDPAWIMGGRHPVGFDFGQPERLSV